MGNRKSDLETAILALSGEGCRVQRIDKGYRVFFPNGTLMHVHLTLTDHRAAKNVRARVRREGVHWPLDTKPDNCQACTTS